MSDIHGIADPYAAAHKNAEGPGDARPTGLQILKDQGLIGKFGDKTILITGGTDGLGLELVRQLAKTNARIIFTARNAAKAERVLQELKSEAATDQQLSGARIEWILMDNSSLASVRAAAKDFAARSTQLNVLIANAGLALAPHSVTEDGFEAHFAVNHLAHFLLFHLLKTLLLSSATPSFNSRVVLVASSASGFSTVQVGNYNLDRPLEQPWEPALAMEGDFNPFVAYGQSKTANIWFANQLEREFGSRGVHGLSLHPGIIFTAAFGTADPRAVEMIKTMVENPSMTNRPKSIEQGIANQVLAAVGDMYEGKGGIYLDDCRPSQPAPDDEEVSEMGHRSWIYNPEGEKRLWEDSLRMVGLEAGA